MTFPARPRSDEDLDALKAWLEDDRYGSYRRFEAGRLRERLREAGLIESYRPILKNGLGIRWRATQAAYDLIYPAVAN
tara:strand:+ start:129 stop:362 length:234 start_codon:yes stop_codon:yes gene_type:complete